MSDHSHCDKICRCQPTAAVQTMDEMDFDRGIWTAALYNDIDRLKKLIAQGDTNKRDNFGYTALHYAARKNNFDACTLLVQNGANVNEKTNSSGSTALHRAAMMGNDKIVELLLKHCASSNIQDLDGNTPLHRAAQNQHLNVVKILVNYNENDKLCVNKKGQTPFDLLPDSIIQDNCKTDDFRSVLKH